MRRIGLYPILLIPIAATAAPEEDEILVGDVDGLVAAVASAPPHSTIRLTPGDYHLTPHPIEEPTCGNCEEPATRVPATVGLLVTGKGLRIVGAGAGETRLHTHAGYGVFFDGCESCALEGVTVTGGARDRDARATDAAVIVKHSRVEIRRCRIEGNIGTADVVAQTVVGVIGIAGREGAEIFAAGNHILRNSWDGVALYRDASAVLVDNVIDGVDRARGETIGGGRGVGIGITWNAKARVRGNLVRNYWKGIGLFVDAAATVEENVVEDILTWGISLWDAGKGRPSGTIRYNAVYRTGACGVAIVRESEAPPAPGELTRNAIVRTGQDPRYDSGEPYCFQTAIARHAVPVGFAIRENFLWDNREPEDHPGSEDIPEEALDASIEGLITRLEGWKALWGSEFLIRFGR